MKKNIIKDFLKNLMDNKTNELDTLVKKEFAVKSVDALKAEKAALAKSMFRKKHLKIKESTETDNVIAKIQQVLEKGSAGKITLNNKDDVEIDLPTANLLVTLFDSLDNENREKMVKTLDSSLEKFMKVVDFAYKNIR